MSPGVKSCRVVSRAPDGTESASTGQMELLAADPALDLAGDPGARPAIALHLHRRRHPGLRGPWKLEPLDGGQRTRVTYEMWATAPFAVPAGMISGMMRRDVPNSP
jgi:hypothetical protein